MNSSSSVFNNLTNGLLTRSRSGFAQIVNYRSTRKQKLQTRTANQWKTWRTLKRYANNIWFQLGGGGKYLNARIVREIWRLHVGSSEDYFVKVIHNACRRDTDLSQQFLNGPHSQEPKELTIAKLAENFYAFFDSIMNEDVLTNERQIKQVSYELGKRHVSYSTAQFNITYFDTINIAMMEELEDTGLFDEIDLKAWQRLISMINEYMFMGYLKGRELIVNVDAIDHRNCMRRSRTCE